MSLEEGLAEVVRRVVREELRGRGEGPQSPSLALKVQEAAERLGGVDPATIRKWIKSGLLPASKAGHEWLIRVADLEPFLARTRVAANAHPVANMNARVARFVAAGRK